MAFYNAFISYSHAKDKPIAASLQSAIQKLGKPWYRRRALRLFRDDTSLSATPNLWPTIEQALGQSSHFVLLASPEAAVSKWVNKEVAYWLDHNSIDTLLIGLTRGELSWDDAAGDFLAHENNSLPPVLAKRFPTEPKWVDLRPYHEGADKRDAKFTELAADFAAAIRGVPKEDLLSQEVRQQRRALRLALGAAISLLVLLAVAGWQWWSAKKGTISALIQSSEAEFTAGEDWTALLTSLRSARLFRTTPFMEYFSPDLRSQLSQSLQQALYGVREYKRLKYKQSGNFSRQTSVGQMDWSPGGETLAFVTGPDEVTLWKPDSNLVEFIHRDKTGTKKDDQILSIGWKPPNGQTLAMSTITGRIEFFDLHTNKFLSGIETGDEGLYGISWRPDGQELAEASRLKGVVLLKPDGVPVHSPLRLDNFVWSVSWSPEPQHLLAAADLHGAVMWENPNDPSSPCKLSLGFWNYSMSWRPDGQYLAVGLDDKSVRLLAHDCKEASRLNGHTEPVTSVSWSSDWRLATASKKDRTVRLWSKDGAPLETFHVLTVHGGVQWRPDGQVLATLDQSGQQGLVRLWKDNPFMQIFFEPAQAPINDAKLSPDGKLLAVASDKSTSLWREDQNHKWLSVIIISGGARSVSWSPDGQFLASAANNTVAIWNRDGTSKATLKDERVGNGVLTVSWHPNGRTLVSGDGNTAVTLWDVDSGLILAQFTCGDWAQSVEWNPANERLLAAGCKNRAGAHWLQWVPDKKEIDSKQLLEEADRLGSDSSVSWSPDGKILAIGRNNRIEFWRLDGVTIHSIDTGDEVGKVAWSPDGGILAVASGNVVKLWKQDGSFITVLKGHTREVTNVTWNSWTLVSSSKDGTVRLWKINKDFANNFLGTLLTQSCELLEGYLQRNPLLSEEDSELQKFCGSVATR
jgi:WD40 repeat protein